MTSLHRASAGDARPTGRDPRRSGVVPDTTGDPGSDGASPVRQRLARALFGRRLQVRYQPIVAAGSRRVVTVQALAGLPEDAESWLPDVLIPLAERHGCVDGTFRQIAGAALRRLRGWRREGHRLRLALNLSRLQLLDPNLPRRIERIVRHSGAIPGDVVLEVTGSHPAGTLSVERAALRELRYCGFVLALNGFGPSHASHARLADCAWDIVKIDRSLVGALARTGKPPAALAKLLRLARDLGVETVAEGIEDAATALLAERFGVTSLQGRHLGAPLPPADCAALLSVAPAGHAGR